jgi:antitoxin VapB
MSSSIPDSTTDEPVRALAKRKGVGLTDAIRLAVSAELDRLDRTSPLRARIAAIRREIVAHEPTGECPDKAFFDELSGDLQWSPMRPRS